RPGGLPEGVVGWHSLAFTQDRREYEIDFVVAHPERGLLVIEVKGGQITLEDGFWWQNGTRMRNPPPRQATEAAHALEHWFRRELGPYDYATFGHALWFPDMSEPPMQSGDARARTLGAEALAWTADAIDSLFERVLPRRPPPKPFVHLLHRL